MKIAALEFAGAETTMGLALVCSAVKAVWPDAEIAKADMVTAKKADYLFVTLIWWRDFYAFLRFLADAGIDPRKRRPHIIIGGMAAINPRPLAGYWHTAIVGDGEACIVEVLRRLESGGDPAGIDGVWSDSGCKLATYPGIPAEQYVDLRTNKATRIEIARGCRAKCAFCHLAFLKPYREQPYEVIRHLVMTAPTKTIALFAPDRCGHSDIAKIEALCSRLGKTNTGSDTRLELLGKIDVASRVRFGVEAFSERTRRKLHKITTNEELLEGLRHVALRLKTPKGKRHTVATLYLIGDLPGEGP
ncbi:MAG: radical SAM protein, partial [Verrucomicrobiota bacterium]